MDSTVHGQKRLNGNLATFEAAYKNPSVGNVFDATLGVALDLSAAVAVGSGLGDTLTSTGDVSDASTGANDTNDVSGMEAGEPFPSSFLFRVTFALQVVHPAETHLVHLKGPARGGASRAHLMRASSSHPLCALEKADCVC